MKEGWLRRYSKRMMWRVVLGLACFVLSLPVAALMTGRDADGFYDGDLDTVLPLARGVKNWVEGDLSTTDYKTSSIKFNGEWLFGTYQMAGLGCLQLIREHPDQRDTFLPTVRRCIERLQDDEVFLFDTNAWRGEVALASLDGPHGHAAYLGYFNLLLGAYIATVPEDDAIADLHRRISRALLRRVNDSSLGLLETYPSEVYPVDNTAVYVSLVLYARNCKRTRMNMNAMSSGDNLHDSFGSTESTELRESMELSDAITKMRMSLHDRSLDPASGFLIQCVDSDTGQMVDTARGSGTALGAYYLSFVDPLFAGELAAALEKQFGSFAGFGLVREYPKDGPQGLGDIDSGPVIFGWGFSSSGFSAGVFRFAEKKVPFTRIFRMVDLVGTPVRQGSRMNFAFGGPLGDAIMLAMFTAQKGGF